MKIYEVFMKKKSITKRENNNSKDIPLPAIHNETNFKDVEAISLASYIISASSKSRIIAKIDSVDKWPNVDGYVELQDGNLLVGKLEVQVKSYDVGQSETYPCPVSFLAYIDLVAIAPVLLFLVDRKVKKSSPY
jgi:hypothetical protein